METIRATSEIPIITKVYDLYRMYYAYLALFPKKDRYGLGGKCEQYIIATLELLLMAGRLPRQEKLAVIQQANVKFDALKVLLRLAKDVKLLDTKKYILLQQHIQEIGRMLGGWQRSLA
jgi:hypothetical protein